MIFCRFGPGMAISHWYIHLVDTVTSTYLEITYTHHIGKIQGRYPYLYQAILFKDQLKTIDNHDSIENRNLYR